MSWTGPVAGLTANGLRPLAGPADSASTADPKGRGVRGRVGAPHAALSSSLSSAKLKNSVPAD
eukprot:10669186-Alexandrium_andersonii.AAC.1